MINEAYLKGLILGVHVGVNKIALTHLQYVDDTILFLAKDDITVQYYKRLLDCFILMTGLEINYNKSSLITWNNKRDREWLESTTSLLQCKTQSFPFKYLGVLIVGNPKGAKFWEPVVKNIEGRLAMWKHKLLSFVGRAQLIKSELVNLPIHYLTLFKLPDIVARKIVSLERRFFGGRGGR